MTILNEFEQGHISYLAFVLQKDSEFLDQFNYHLIDIMESGLIHNTIMKWLGNPYTLAMLQGAAPLGYDDVFFLALVVSAGASFGIGILLLELLIRHH